MISFRGCEGEVGSRCSLSEAYIKGKYEAAAFYKEEALFICVLLQYM